MAKVSRTKSKINVHSLLFAHHCCFCLRDVHTITPAWVQQFHNNRTQETITNRRSVPCALLIVLIIMSSNSGSWNIRFNSSICMQCIRHKYSNIGGGYLIVLNLFTSWCVKFASPAFDFESELASRSEETKWTRESS